MKYNKKDKITETGLETRHRDLSLRETDQDLSCWIMVWVGVYVYLLSS